MTLLLADMSHLVTSHIHHCHINHYLHQVHHHLSPCLCDSPHDTHCSPVELTDDADGSRIAGTRCACFFLFSFAFSYKTAANREGSSSLHVLEFLNPTDIEHAEKLIAGVSACNAISHILSMKRHDERDVERMGIQVDSPFLLSFFIIFILITTDDNSAPIWGSHTL